MKKPKFQLKIDRNGNCKIYINKKWQKNVTQIELMGNLKGYTIILEQYYRDERGQLVVEGEGNNLQLRKEYHRYTIDRKG